MASTPTSSTDKLPVRYLIIGRARSGTTLMHLTLMGHPQVSALNDELRPHPLLTEGMAAFTFGNDLDEERETAPRRIFDALTGIGASTTTRALGAKTVCNSATTARQMITRLRADFPELRIIHIVRNDLAALYGSARIAKKTGVMHSWSVGAQERTLNTCRIPRHPFLRFCAMSLEATRTLRALADSHAYLELSYEDYLADAAAINRQLFDFLSLDQVPVTWLRSEKVLPPPESYISNYMKAVGWTREVARLLDNGDPGRTLLRARVFGKLADSMQRLVASSA